MQLDEALRLLNGWWIEGKVKKDLVKKYRRAGFREAYGKLLKYREAVILSGLRRVGKTTIMYQMIDELLNSAGRTGIVYFTFDYGASELTEILDSYGRITGADWKKERVYLFLDEIQKSGDWGPRLKMLYDAFPNLRFVVSGSASLQLERRAMDSLVGRHFLIDIPVLSLVEYYSLRHGVSVDNIPLYEKEIESEFDSYVRKPFPELAAVDDEKTTYEYIRESVVAKILSQDLPGEFGNVDVPLLNSLVGLFYAEPGMALNVDALSRTLRKRKQEVERHVYMLEFSKLIRIVRNYLLVRHGGIEEAQEGVPLRHIARAVPEPVAGEGRGP